jgi:nucleotide-binding universal stress UspA family protein
MTRRILCAVDFSEFSRAALDRAVTLAALEGGALTVLHVNPLVTATGAVPFGPEGPGPFGLHRFDRDEAIAALQAFVDADGPPGVPVQFEAPEAASIHGEILAQADRLRADLIVLGTHGRSGFDRLLLGSTTERVLRRAKVPVLTVPAAEGARATVRPPFTRIICAVDFSESSTVVLDHALAIARAGSGRVTVVHVVELLPVAYEPMVTPPFDATQFRAAVEKAAHAQLQALVPAGLRDVCQLQVTSAARAFEGILGTATDWDADLIVIGVHGRNALDRLLFGSTAERVVRRATCPVLSVRMPA